MGQQYTNITPLDPKCFINSIREQFEKIVSNIFDSLDNIIEKYTYICLIYI